MITLKLPYSSSGEFQELLLSYQKEQTKVIKISYNKFKDGLKEKEVRNSLKSYNNLSLLDSWFTQSAIYEGKSIHSMIKETNQKAFVFGGLPNLDSYLKGKISKDEYKLKKLLPLSIIGEKLQMVIEK